MGWKAKRGREQQVLNSIVSRLLSIADLAEDAALRSPWVRWCVLWSPALPNVRYGTEPADALDIAASLRALAVIVSGMAAYRRRVSVWRQGQAFDEPGHNSGRHHASVQPLAGAVFPRIECRDTS